VGYTEEIVPIVSASRTNPRSDFYSRKHQRAQRKSKTLHSKATNDCSHKPAPSGRSLWNDIFSTEPHGSHSSVQGECNIGTFITEPQSPRCTHSEQQQQRLFIQKRRMLQSEAGLIRAAGRGTNSSPPSHSRAISPIIRKIRAQYVQRSNHLLIGDCTTDYATRPLEFPGSSTRTQRGS
jgi:hypothetical protein